MYPAYLSQMLAVVGPSTHRTAEDSPGSLVTLVVVVLSLLAVLVFWPRRRRPEKQDETVMPLPNEDYVWIPGGVYRIAREVPSDVDGPGTSSLDDRKRLCIEVAEIGGIVRRLPRVSCDAKDKPGRGFTN